MKKRILSVITALALCFSTTLPAAAAESTGGGYNFSNISTTSLSAERQAILKSKITKAANKKISVRMLTKNGSATDIPTGGDQTELGVTHTVTVTPKEGKYLFGGYFAGIDYYKTNPSHYEYESMKLESPKDIDPVTHGGIYSFVATEFIPIENDSKYDYICLYFYCGQLPTKVWPAVVSGKATNQDGGLSYTSKYELCGDPGTYTGYYQLVAEDDRPWLSWEVVSITDARVESEKLGGTVSFDNNHLTYVPTENEFGRTVHLQVRPVMGLVHEENTPIDFYIEVPIAKEESSITISKDLSKTYDADAVNLTRSDCAVTGSRGNVTFKYQQDVDGEWKDIAGAPKDVGTYRVKAVLASDSQYNGAESEYKEFTIAKATPDYEVPTGLTATYGDTLATVKLPDGFTWKNETQVADELGEHSFIAIFTPKDTNNYEVVEVEVPVKVISTPPSPPSGGGTVPTNPTYPPEVVDSDNGSVQITPSRPHKGDEVTITPKPEEGYDVDKVTVTDKNGNPVDVTDNGDGTFTFQQPDGSVTIDMTFVPHVSAVVTLQNGTEQVISSPDDVIEIPQSSTFTVQFTSQKALDKFAFNTGNGMAIATGTISAWNGTSGIYTLYGLGVPGSENDTTGVYINGVKLFTMRVVPRPLTCDTTIGIDRKVGDSYIFWVKPDDPNATFTFNTANGNMLQTSIVKDAYPDAQGRYYCRLTVAGSGGTVGVYCNINGNTYKLFGVTCQ